MKKSVFKVIVEAIVHNGFKDFKMPTSRIDHRRLSIDEIKQYIVEEFGAAKKASDEDIQEPDKGWSDAELANEIDWVKKLDLKEFFKKRNK